MLHVREDRNPVDDTRTRDPRSGRPHPELPESLAWLYDPAPEDRSAELSSPEPPSALDDGESPRADTEALPTLLPISAPPDEPTATAYPGPVRGLRGAFARLDESRAGG